jgi:hypothetical protein
MLSAAVGGLAAASTADGVPGGGEGGRGVPGGGAAAAGAAAGGAAGGGASAGVCARAVTAGKASSRARKIADRLLFDFQDAIVDPRIGPPRCNGSLTMMSGAVSEL